MNADIETLIDNFGGGFASSIIYEKLETVQNLMETYLTAPTIFELYDLENKSYLGSRKEVTDSEIINVKGYTIYHINIEKYVKNSYLIQMF